MQFGINRDRGSALCQEINIPVIAAGNNPHIDTANEQLTFLAFLVLHDIPSHWKIPPYTVYRQPVCQPAIVLIIIITIIIMNVIVPCLHQRKPTVHYNVDNCRNK